MAVDERSDALIHLQDLQKALKEVRRKIMVTASYINHPTAIETLTEAGKNLQIALGASETLKRDIEELEHDLYVAEESLAAAS